MPPRSEKQRRFFRWAEKHPKESGVKKSVAKEFNAADAGGKLPEQVKDGKARREAFYGKE